MLGHSRQRDALFPKSTVHRDGLDTLSRPSFYLGIKVNPLQGENLVAKMGIPGMSSSRLYSIPRVSRKGECAVSWLGALTMVIPRRPGE
jgi:hypothetical protein